MQLEGSNETEIEQKTHLFEKQREEGQPAVGCKIEPRKGAILLGKGVHSPTEKQGTQQIASFGQAHEDIRHHHPEFVAAATWPEVRPEDLCETPKAQS